MSLEPNSVLHGRYQIERELGRGGMGAVYLAFDQTLNIHVAVKENLNPGPEAERQFRREASLLATLRHPNLPRVTDHFILEGRQYLVMDYVAGEDLHSRSARRMPSVAEVLTWADAICAALAYLHSRQPPVIHRDIKPANLKLQPDGTIILVDFGIAKVADQTQTTTGARALTPGFSPPEQYGGGRTDARSDQYSSAATLYALLTGQAPVDGLERVLNNAQLTPARALNPAVPPHVDATLARALSANRDGRFPDVLAFWGALRGAPEAATVSARPAAQAETTKPARREAVPPRRRLRSGLVLGAGAIGVVVLGAAAFLGGKAGLFSLGAPTATATFTSVPPTEIPVPSPTPEPPTATPSPTPSLTPTPMPTATEVVPLLGGGGRIAFVSDREDGRTLQIWTMNSDGTDPRQLTYGPGDKAQPRWSPDGTRLLFVAPESGYGLDIWVINADGTGISNLTRTQGDDTDPAWSPDGTRIAFSSTRVIDLRQVYVMGVTCSEPPESCTSGQARNVTAGFAIEYSPAWSPDGTTLAVAASIREALGRILLRSPDGGEPTFFDLNDTIIGADNLRWSPDGKYLIFTWFRPGLNEIYLVPLSNYTYWERLTNTAGNKEPAFSPDGRYIVFTSTRDQNPEIYMMTANGADERNLTNHPARDMQPDWQPLPPP